jgi:hypothetical protein
MASHGTPMKGVGVADVTVAAAVAGFISALL